MVTLACAVLAFCLCMVNVPPTRVRQTPPVGIERRRSNGESVLSDAEAYLANKKAQYLGRGSLPPRIPTPERSDGSGLPFGRSPSPGWLQANQMLAQTRCSALVMLACGVP